MSTNRESRLFTDIRVLVTILRSRQIRLENERRNAAKTEDFRRERVQEEKVQEYKDVFYEACENRDPLQAMVKADQLVRVARKRARAKANAEMDLNVLTSQKELEEKIAHMIQEIRSEFERFNTYGEQGVTMTDKVMDNRLWLTFTRGTISKSIDIPLPTINEKGLRFLVCGDVVRVLSDYWLEYEQRRLDYLDVIYTILCGEVEAIFPLLESKGALLGKIVRSFNKDQTSYMVYQTQRLVSEVVNRMPLYETDMNSWVMNRRLVIIDWQFDHLSSPEDRLKYQVEKNKKYYDKFGWTSIGLSDGVLSDKNYILTVNLREHTPFGYFHNPQRNLYSTLCMKGDELPRFRSQSMQNLIERGITRKGWNLATAILDTPMNFEDQILVDNRHRSLFHTYHRRYMVYGDKLMVRKGEEINTGDKIGFSRDGQAVVMDLRCDKGRVEYIRRETQLLDGEPIDYFVVSIEGKRFLRDGSKFSNLHGNKGIVRFMDLGYYVHPATGEEIPIDVMISAKSVNKRKNFGQLLEALFNNIHDGDDPIILEDDFDISEEECKRKLVEKGWPDDATCMIHTYCGEFQGIVGRMFWGVTKDGEDASWDEHRTEITNNRDLRVSGLKFSHVEMRALVTRFGPRNPITREIISHCQGSEILRDEIRILKSAQGIVDYAYPVIDAADVRAVDIKQGLFHDADNIKGTIVDEEYMPDGFLLRLPCYFQAIVNNKRRDDFMMGIRQDNEDLEERTVYTYNLIFIPNSFLRRCWRHPSGKWGLSTLGSKINQIVYEAHRFIETNASVDEVRTCNAVSRYFLEVSRMMSTKSGELSVYGMSVRYPFSARGTATLDENLPKNTVEIHEEMAKVMKVKTGDVILAERFPCLGFMSIRPQYVKVTDDPQCKYVIRVSQNSLVSMNLDFDGDTLFLASFFTPEAIEMLRNEMKKPNQICEDIIEQMNAKKIPEYREMTLNDYQIHRFPDLTVDEHADIVSKATGVKSHTGPVIALAYNLMRIVEGNIPYENVAQHAHLEVLLDFLGNTVFSQKHGIKSLQEEATDAICTADVQRMVELGFDEAPSALLCGLIRKEAAELGVVDLHYYHYVLVKQEGRSKIINRIVRVKHPIYFATRASQGPFLLMDRLERKPNDLPSMMLFKVLESNQESTENKLERIKASRIKVKNQLTTDKMKSVYDALASFVDNLCN